MHFVQYAKEYCNCVAKKRQSCSPHKQYLLLAHSFEDKKMAYCVLKYQHLHLVVAVSRNKGPDCHHLL